MVQTGSVLSRVQLFERAVQPEVHPFNRSLSAKKTPIRDNVSASSLPNGANLTQDDERDDQARSYPEEGRADDQASYSERENPWGAVQLRHQSYPKKLAPSPGSGAKMGSPSKGFRSSTAESPSSPLSPRSMGSPRRLHPALKHASPRASYGSSGSVPRPKESPVRYVDRTSPSPKASSNQYDSKLAYWKQNPSANTQREVASPAKATGPTAQGSPLGSTRSISTRASKYFGRVRNRSPALIVSEQSSEELRRKLDAASVVMEEERSSIGSSSSSRSSLSNEELGSIARRAMILSKVSKSINEKRSEKSPLSQMLSNKRAPKIAIEGNPDDHARYQDDGYYPRNSQEVSQSSTSDSGSRYATGSVLSSKMSRAEKVAALRQFNRSFAPSPQHESTMATSTLSSGNRKASPSPSRHYEATRNNQDSELSTKWKNHRIEAVRQLHHPVLAFNQSNGHRARRSSKERSQTTFSDAMRSTQEKRNTSASNSENKFSTVRRRGEDEGRHSYTKDPRTKLVRAKEEPYYVEEGMEDATIDHSSFLQEDTVFTGFQNDPESVQGTTPGSQRSVKDLKSYSKSSQSDLNGESITQHKSDGSELVYSSNESRASSRVARRPQSGDGQPKYRPNSTLTQTKVERWSDEDGDLSKRDVNSLSTNTDASKEDAMRWWQKTYGNKVSGDTNNMVRKVFAGSNPEEVHQNIQRSELPGEEDVAVRRETRAVHAARVRGSNVLKPVVEKQPPAEEDEDIFFGLEEESRASRSGDRTTPSKRSSGSGKQVVRAQTSTSSPSLNEPLSPRQMNSQKREGDQYGMMVEPSSNLIPATSDITGSLAGGKIPKSKIKTRTRVTYQSSNLVSHRELVHNENAEPKAEDCDESQNSGKETQLFSVGSDENSLTLDTSMNEENDNDAPSVLTSLGAVIVNSIDIACQLPDQALNMPCTPEGRSVRDRMCEAEDRCKSAGKKCNAFPGDTTVHDGETTYFDEGAPSLTSTANSSKLIPKNHNRDHETSTVDADENDIRPRMTSSSSLLLNANRQIESHKEHRQLAQKRLLEHARKAVNLLEQEDIGYGENSGHSKNRVQPEPIHEDQNGPSPPIKTPRTLAAEISHEERIAVANFSSKLRRHGVAVLKLNRRSKWQTRYLTVSRDKGATLQSFVCPKALLWLKQPPNSGDLVLEENGEGRGGFWFKALASIETKFSSVPPAAIPRKYRSSFPEYAGVVVEYDCDEGIRTLTLCFRTRREASSFWTAVKILREVVTREEELAKEEQEVMKRLV